VATNGDGHVENLLWGPDGRWLAYTLVQPQPRAGGPARRAGIWRIGVDGVGERRLLDAGVETVLPILARPLPKGSRLLFWSDPGYSASLLADGVPLSMLPSQGGRARRLSSKMLAYGSFLSIAPDGERLVVTEGEGRETWSRKRLVLVDLESGKRTPLTDPTVAALFPAWAPDGVRLAYAAGPNVGAADGTIAASALAGRRLWLLRPGQQGAPIQLTRDPAYRDEYPRWLADGSTLLFPRVDRQGKAALWLLRADGNPRQLTEIGPAAPVGSGFYGYVEWGEYYAVSQPK
jgi:Tol biopolymer transport system component